jgi:hypothetical protein
MKTQQIINEIQKMNGNYIRESGHVYISPSNMSKLGIYFENSDDVETILITPYLINIIDEALYELHYYEFEIEVLNVSKSNYLEFSGGNILPNEITNNIKSKAVVSQKDKRFLIKALQDYLTAMGQMTFEQDRQHDKRLENAELFYQIF